jgi:uncharacterized protein
MQEHEQESVPRPKRTRRGLLARTALSILIPYVAVVAMFALFQRKLIYLPLREAASAAETGYNGTQLHDVHLTTHDGLELRGWLVLADGAAVEADDFESAVQDERPLIVFFPGNGGNRSYRLKEIRQFTGLGCDVLYFDYRGYADNPGSPSEPDFAADARSVWEFATEELDVPADRILIWGESLGGGVATRLASEICEEGTTPRGLMLRSTFSSLVDAGAYHYPWLPVRWLLLDRYPSVDRIGSVTCPILVLHGNADRIVPIEQGRALFDAAPGESDNGIRKKFVELPDTGHNDVMYVAADQVETAVSDFLQSVAQSSTAITP